MAPARYAVDGRIGLTVELDGLAIDTLSRRLPDRAATASKSGRTSGRSVSASIDDGATATATGSVIVTAPATNEFWVGAVTGSNVAVNVVETRAGSSLPTAR